MAIIPLKIAEMTWLLQSGYFLGVFWDFFIRWTIFFRKYIFLIWDIFKISASSFLMSGKRGGGKCPKTVLNDPEDHYSKSQSAKNILHNKTFGF